MILKCQRIYVYKTCRELCCDVCILPTLLLSISTQYMYSCVCVCVCVYMRVHVSVYVYLYIWMFECLYVLYVRMDVVYACM